MTVTVVNVSRDACEVYAGRSRRNFPPGQTVQWGNPFVLGRHGSRAVAVAAHRLLLAVQIWRGEVTEAELIELDGCRVGCHCAPHPCHADNIADAVRAAGSGELREWADRAIRESDDKLKKLVEEYCRLPRSA